MQKLPAKDEWMEEETRPRVDISHPLICRRYMKARGSLIPPKSPLFLWRCRRERLICPLHNRDSRSRRLAHMSSGERNSPRAFNFPTVLHLPQNIAPRLSRHLARSEKR